MGLFLSVLVLQHADAQMASLLPKPQQVTVLDGTFQMEDAELFIDKFENGLEISFSDKGIDDSGEGLAIHWVSVLEGVEANTEEGYRLEIGEKGVAIFATNLSGAFYALQTLKQMTAGDSGDWEFPFCTIVDWPAFRIRGFMHDVGRSFISVEELKRQIKILSFYKINVFHWHLTEDLAWRLESKIFPELNNPDHFGRFEGQFYSHEEVKEILDFAKKHMVTVIPEIEMPGHSAAFERAMGYDMQSPDGKRILRELLREAGSLFAGLPFFHVGTDEVEFTDPEFVPEMVELVRSMGFQAISWNPGWNYKLGEIDVLHLWSYRGKAPEGIPFIDSRFHYINHYDPFADLIGLYRSNVSGHSKGTNIVLGAVLAIWNDRKLEDESQIMLQNNFYPLMLTFAEKLWQGGGEGDFDQIGTLIASEGTDAYLNWSAFEERLLDHKDRYFSGVSFPYYRQSDIHWRVTAPFPNEGVLGRVFPPEQKFAKAYDFEGKRYGTKKASGAGIYLRHVWGDLVPGFIENPLPNHTVYAFTNIFSPKEQEVKAIISFHDYGRSEKDLPPPAGQWDWKESEILINGKRLSPPDWASHHKVRNNEIPLTNENWQTRNLIEVKLEKGWNRILLKLPVGKFGTDQIRLVKWMFNFAIVEAPDLIYYPDLDLAN